MFDEFMAWELEKEIISAGYRHLAKKAHPDKNPSTASSERMVALNAARDGLLNILEQFQRGPIPMKPQDFQTTGTAWPNAPKQSTTAPPFPQRMFPIDILNYYRAQIAKDPLAAGILDILEGFVSQTAAKYKRKRR